jgi:DNA (cytosine-5)-methyltransferase 1
MATLSFDLGKCFEKRLPTMRNHRRTFRFIDLFSGAGGLAQGFRKASDSVSSFRSVYAVEIEPLFAASYAANFLHDVFVGPIDQLRMTDLPEADIVIRGPPCQGFSPLGKMLPAENHGELNELWRHFFRVVECVRPQAFVLENVPQFLKSTQFVAAKLIAEKLGYTVDAGILNAVDFGVPQVRRRGFAIGLLDGDPHLPQRSENTDPVTLFDAIGTLAKAPLVYELPNGSSKNGNGPHAYRADALHIGRNPRPESLERYRVIPPGGNRFDLMRERPDITPRCWGEKKTGSTDVMGRLEWDKPAVTIRTEFFKPEKGRYLHPEQNRSITHWEAARIQTFPDSFLFCGSKIQIARQIGNAVPPRLAEVLARHLLGLLAR